jgi:glycosyltransferase involved in cell wall biosynthesis
MSIDLSVVIPTFRRPRQLADALASVLRQEGVTLEVFVVDDSAEGSARAVVERIGDPRVTYLLNPQPTHGCPSIVRNLAWPLARGELVHFFDDDDLVPEGHYAAVKAAFAARPGIGVVFGRIAPFGDAPAEQMRHEEQFFRDAAARARLCSRFGAKWGYAACMMFGRTLLVCGAAVVRRDCVERIGGFDPRIRIGEDVDFYARAMRQGGAAFLDRVALHYRIGSPSLMHNPERDPGEAQQLRQARRWSHDRYRLERGIVEFYALRSFAVMLLSLL